jgi:hypothetical protein
MVKLKVCVRSTSIVNVFKLGTVAFWATAGNCRLPFPDITVAAGLFEVMVAVIAGMAGPEFVSDAA